MVYQPTIEGLSDVRGAHYKQGLEYLYFAGRDAPGALPGNRGVFRMPVNPAQIIVTADAQPAASGSASFNFNSSVIGATITQRQMRWSSNALRPTGSARIHLLAGVLSLDEVTPTWLANDIDWDDPAQYVASPSSVSEQGTSTPGIFYAVRYVVNGAYRYVKLRVWFDDVTRFDWVTYRVDQEESIVCRLSAGDDVRDVALTDYETEMYLSGQVAGQVGVHRFVRLPGTIPSFTDSPGNFDTIGDVGSDPQQLAVDGGFVYVVSGSHVYRFTVLEDMDLEDPVGPQPIVSLPAGVNGIGLLLDATAEGVWAYISDDQGYIRLVNLSEGGDFGSPLPAPENGDEGAFQVPLPGTEISLSCGHLGWGNAERTEILVTDHTHGRVLRFSVVDGSFRQVASGLTAPWSAVGSDADRFFVASAGEIGFVTETIVVAGGNYLLGIGLIPFQAITSSVANPASPVFPDGRANTGAAFPGESYFFHQYPNLPFGGALFLQLNLGAMYEGDIRFYSVSLQRRPLGGEPSVIPRPITEPFSNLRWNEGQAMWESVQREGIPSNQNRYVVPPVGDLWYNPYLAAKISTSEGDTGWNEIIVRFFDASGVQVNVPGDTGRRLIYIDNRRYKTSIRLPRIGTETEAPAAAVSPTPNCGCVTYPTVNKNDLVEVDFQAWQDNGAPGDYHLRFYRGGTHLGVLYQTGPVESNDALISKIEVTPGVPLRVGHLMGHCNVANIRLHVSIASRVIDGFGWVNLGSYSDVSFTMLHGGVPLDTDWSPPPST